jgi:two-component system, NtrC family, response regulator HydG
MLNQATRLLIVDDEQDTCSNLSDIFTDLGYQVEVAYDGPAALALVERNTFEVALLDLKMPGMDGLELSRRIHRISAGTVAIIVTAYASSATAASVLDAGAWRIVPKPVDFPKLLQLVEEAMHQPLVLVVDDDYELCDSLWELFHDHSYRVCLAYDVSEAVNKLRERSYHVVLVDMKLPTGNGTEVLACLPQANPQARSILITGHRSEMELLVQKALANGANAVCYKPFDVELLLDTVSRLC